MSALASPIALATEPGRADNVWRAPLVPAALAVTVGILADRVASVPLPVALVAMLACLAAWSISQSGRSRGLPIAYLLGALACLGAAYHHAYRDISAEDDISRLASDRPRPARLRGVLVEEPFTARRPPDPLRSMPDSNPTFAVLAVTGYRTTDDWTPEQGRVRLILDEPLDGIHIGDTVEVTGRLMLPPGPANPGESDPREPMRDQQIGATLSVRHSADAVAAPEAHTPWSFTRWLTDLRGWGQRRIGEAVAPEQAGLAMALILGEGAPMSNAEWDKYKRTGVVHLLIVSGQHLVILGSFLWLVFRCLGVRRRRGAIVVAAVLLLYALVTGGRPPQMRAAVMVCTAALGLMLGRVTLPANAFALAWLVVAAINPTDMFTPGCMLSFLTVAVLHWGIGRWITRQPDPLDHLADEGRPAHLRWLRATGRRVLIFYAVSVICWLAAAPLVASLYHVVAPIGIVLLPTLSPFMMVALIAGFLLLLASVVMPFAVPLLGWVTSMSLMACDSIVTFCDMLPGTHWYVGTVPTWWLWVFYPALLAVLLLPLLQVRWSMAAGLGWLCVGLVGGSAGAASNELRVTFLAVGHGGCTVMESPDGRVFLYDAGTMTGPDAIARHVAPYLWHRGIRRIDEIFLSHADLDHFNGLTAILARFTVGQVSCTPTFAERDNTAVRTVLDALKDQRIPMRVIRAGDILQAGDVTLEVLHPPADGPPGKENFRSLVLRVRHLDHVLLLTGDMEGPGMAQVLEQPAGQIDVLMAPHHGSKTANTPALADWARPRVVISCEGPPRGPSRPAEPFTPQGATFLGTWPHGAVTVRSSAAGLTVETFVTGQRMWIRR
jgi:competence protein ComEC